MEKFVKYPVTAKRNGNLNPRTRSTNHDRREIQLTQIFEFTTQMFFTYLYNDFIPVHKYLRGTANMCILPGVGYLTVGVIRIRVGVG